MLLFDLYSAQPVGNTKFHGGGEYIKTIFYKLLELYPNISISACFNYDKFIDDWILEEIKCHNVYTINTKSYDDIFLELNSGKYNSFFSGIPYWFDRNKLNVDVYCIGTIHGLRPLECTFDKYEFINASFPRQIIGHIKRKITHNNKIFISYRNSIDSLNYIVTDSYHSLYSIYNFFGQIDNINVIYPPIKKIITNNCEIPIAEDQKFILMVSCNRWEKNPMRGIMAIDQLYDKNKLKGIKTVCVGLEFSKIKYKIHNIDKFISLGYLKTEELEWLYKNCEVFFYPTLNEGFGYPPLEAMAYGKTCVVSAVCSLPEICGEAVYYVNPYDITEMQTRLIEAICKKIDDGVIRKHVDVINKRQAVDLCNFVSLLDEISHR